MNLFQINKISITTIDLKLVSVILTKDGNESARRHVTIEYVMLEG